jgi:hypothetical protein
MGLKRSALYALGIVILCIVSLYLLLRIRRSVEGFEEVTDCISVPGVQYVRLYPSALLPPAEQFLTLTQVRVLDEDGNNLAQGKPVTPSTGSAITDGATEPRYIGPGRSWTSPMAGQANFIEVGLGVGGGTVSSVMYIGAIDAPKQRNKGVKVVLLDANRQPIQRAEVTSSTEDFIQTLTFCSDKKIYNTQIIAPPASIECNKIEYPELTTGDRKGRQWLCKEDKGAQALLKGPFDKAKRYLNKGDHVCVLTTNKTRYSCYEPYDPETSPSLYMYDDTQYTVGSAVNTVCSVSANFLKDLSNSILGIDKMGKSVINSYDTLNKSEEDLNTLINKLECNKILEGNIKDICDNIETAKESINVQKGIIWKMNTMVRGPVDNISSSRAKMNEIYKKYNCG